MDPDQDVFEQGFEKLTDLVFGHTNGTPAVVTPAPGLTTEDPFFQDTFFHPSLIEDDAPCKAILHCRVGGSYLRVWDLLILAPNIMFLLFLFLRLASIRTRLRTVSSTVLQMIHSLVLALSFASTLRCFVSMLLYLASPEHDVTDALIWETGRLMFLTVELALGGLLLTAAGQDKDTAAHCRRVLAAAASAAAVVSAAQLYLELSRPYYGYTVLATGYQVYGQGGPTFLAVFSFVMSLFYFAVLVAGLASARHGGPSAVTAAGYRYYLYSCALLLHYVLSCAGGATLALRINSGLCLINLSTYFYFSSLAPLIYTCFLQPHFSTAQSSFQFSYRSQLDEEDEYHEDDLYGNISISSNISDQNM